MKAIMNRTNNIDKYCSLAKCNQQVEYNKLKTSTNNPNISQKMRYSEYLKQHNSTCNKVMTPTGEIIG